MAFIIFCIRYTCYFAYKRCIVNCVIQISNLNTESVLQCSKPIDYTFQLTYGWEIEVTIHRPPHLRQKLPGVYTQMQILSTNKVYINIIYFKMKYTCVQILDNYIHGHSVHTINSDNRLIPLRQIICEHCSEIIR